MVVNVKNEYSYFTFCQIRTSKQIIHMRINMNKTTIKKNKKCNEINQKRFKICFLRQNSCERFRDGWSVLQR